MDNAISNIQSPQINLPPTEFVSAVGGHPVVAQILWQRGVRTAQQARAFLDPDRYTPAVPFDLPGMREAVARLWQAIERGEHIRVWGDLDADGQTSTSVLLLGLRQCGAQVDFTIPNRASSGRGLSQAGITRARDEGVQLIITCDCGSTDMVEAAHARALGVDLIITDHHDLSAVLPEAVAVINPRRLPADHSMTHLPGAGVAYMVVQALWERRSEGAEEHTLHSPLLDIVAIGLVADVAQLRGDARYLLQRGLAQLRAQPRVGLRALMNAARIDPAEMSEETISYQIAPRLNAVGRLDDAALSVELLTTDDAARAAALAARIETLNQERRTLQRATEDEAMRVLANDLAAQRQPVIVVVASEWNTSVLGVVASAITNRYGKPAVVISVRPGEVGRGSARSMPGLDINAAIQAQGLTESGGGHPMAAGFAIRSENVAALREGLIHYVLAHPPTAVPDEVQVDAVIAWQDATPQLCEELERLAPFGAGNPRPLLKSPRLSVVRVEPFGNHEARHQAVFFDDATGHVNRVVHWRGAGHALPNQCDLVYSVHRDWHRGKQRLQLQLVRMEPPSDLGVTGGAQFNIVDRRAITDRPAELRRLTDEYGVGSVQVWEEGAKAKSQDDEHPARRTRLQLEPASVLVIWSAPPGAQEMISALERAQPQTVVLLTAPTLPGQDDMQGVLQQVAGMIKVSERRGEGMDDPAVIARMAARIGQRESTLRAALDYHQATAAGHAANASQAQQVLRYLLTETLAYRDYFQVAAADQVLRKTAN